MYKYDIVDLICAKDSNTGHLVTDHTKNIHPMRDKYTLNIMKT